MDIAILKATISVALAGIAAYIETLLVPLLILIIVMMLDYISGLIRAYIMNDLCPKQGMKGILKKVGNLLLVSAGMIIDWLLNTTFLHGSVNIPNPGVVAILISVWLIMNELISILENLYTAGISPIPGLDKLLLHLRANVAKSEQTDTADASESKKGLPEASGEAVLEQPNTIAEDSDEMEPPENP